ncbi:MAG TPA: glycosyltransferase family 2 protein [Burkholderiales bacterium]
MEPPPPPRPATCAVVVTYHPEGETLSRLVAAALGQVEAVVVVDNGSGPGLGDWLRGHDPERVRFEPLGENRGVAHAQNRGIEWALARGFDWVLILDHDSVPAPGMVAKLRSALLQAQARGLKVAAAGPQYVDPVTGHRSYFVSLRNWKLHRAWCPDGDAEAVLPADLLISSGSLIPAAALREVGPLDDALFIDYVDTDWCLRAKSRGYTAIGVCGAVMEHNLGAGSVQLKLLGRRRQVSLYGPLRLYYRARNSVLLYRKPYVPWRWVFHDLLRLAQLLGFFSLLQPPRLRNLGMMLRGLADGLRGRGGPYAPSRRTG